MPTGVAIRDPRGQLFNAAERVLLRDGPSGLTSRAVTAEAGVAKGVLHRHFADFDAFLAELALDRVVQISAQALALRARAGSGSVAGNLATALADLFSPAVLAFIRLVIARDELRAQLRVATGSRIPFLSESTAMVADYLAVERDLGRIASDADISALAPTLIGAAHLLFTDADGAPEPVTVERVLAAVLATARQTPSLELSPPAKPLHASAPPIWIRTAYQAVQSELRPATILARHKSDAHSACGARRVVAGKCQ